MKEVKNECKTVTYNDKSYLFYNGYPLVRTIYQEQPKDLENLSVSFIYTNDEQEVHLQVKTPIYYSETDFDYSTPYIMSKEEFNRFQQVPFDPLDRNFYPLQDRVDNNYLVECSDELGFRSYINKDLLDHYVNLYKRNDESYDRQSIYTMLLDLYQKEDNHLEVSDYMGTVMDNFDEELVKRFYYGDQVIRAIKCEDVFGEVICFEPYNVLEVNELKIEKWLDWQTKDVYITVNGKVFNHYKRKGNVMFGSYNPLVPIEDSVILLLDLSRFQDIIFLVSKHSMVPLCLGQYINRTKINRSKKLPGGVELLDYTIVQSNEINGFELNDYKEYKIVVMDN